ncbi:MAG TPA: hypothetical protein DEF36_20935 [Desulfotomaculum sp.]|nr:hypothetical protein [Desulfotomaculum sp.]
MKKKLVSLLLTLSLLVLALAPAAFAAADNKQNGHEKIQKLNQDQVLSEELANTEETVAEEVYEGNQGRHKGIPNALTHVKNPQARVVLQAILEGKSVCDEVYKYKNSLAGPEDIDAGELEAIAEEIEQLAGDDTMDSGTRALTFKYMAQIHVKAGKMDDALKFINLSVRDNSLDEETFKELDSLYAKKMDTKVKVYVNGQTPIFDVAPRIVEGRTLVPVRFIAEALNANVTYDQDTETVNIQGQANIRMKIKSRIALVNGQEVELDVPAEIENGRTMVPLRFISEGFKCKVDFYGQSNLVSITD